MELSEEQDEERLSGSGSRGESLNEPHLELEKKEKNLKDKSRKMGKRKGKLTEKEWHICKERNNKRKKFEENERK